MSARERARLKIRSLPGDLGEACDLLEKSTVMKDALGQHIFENMLTARRSEWHQYIARVHQWELDEYLTRY